MLIKNCNVRFLRLKKNCTSQGHKTASVVMSQGFDIQHLIDTHIHRLAQRA